MAETLIDAHTLETFLQRLGQCFRHQATLYLVGGASLLLAAGKPSTFDIDLQSTSSICRAPIQCSFAAGLLC